MRSTPQSFYKSAQWRHCRDAYIRSVGGLCERCKAVGIISPATIVHHRVHLNGDNYNDPSISLNFDNLEALCLDCHNKEHFKDTQVPLRWRYENGQLVIKEDR